jgi:hypothetical protein
MVYERWSQEQERKGGRGKYRKVIHCTNREPGRVDHSVDLQIKGCGKLIDNKLKKKKKEIRKRRVEASS